MVRDSNSTASSWSSLRISALIVAILVCVAYGTLSSPFGAIDFRAYYSAAELFVQGQNPYDPQLLHGRELLYGEGELQNVWNPPWLFPLLAPLTALPWEMAVPVWVMFNIGAMFGIAGIASRLQRQGSRPPSVLLTLSVVTFVPAWENVIFGQLSLLITLAFAGALLAYEKRQDTLSGALLFIPCIKPHAVYLPAFLLGISAWAARRWRMFLACGVTLSLASVAAAIINPSIFQNWIAMEGSPLLLKAATIVTPIRQLLLSSSSTLSVWPVIAVPLACGVATIIAVARKGSWTRTSDLLLVTIPLSCLTAPYGWTFDQSVLLISHVMLIVAQPTRLRQRRMVIVLACYQAIVLTSSAVLSGQHQFFWVPIGYLLLGWSNLSQRAAEKTSADALKKRNWPSNK